jgi:hypothetical protein
MVNVGSYDLKLGQLSSAVFPLPVPYPPMARFSINPGWEKPLETPQYDLTHVPLGSGDNAYMSLRIARGGTLNIGSDPEVGPSPDLANQPKLDTAHPSTASPTSKSNYQTELLSKHQAVSLDLSSNTISEHKAHIKVTDGDINTNTNIQELLIDRLGLGELPQGNTIRIKNGDVGKVEMMSDGKIYIESINKTNPADIMTINLDPSSGNLEITRSITGACDSSIKMDALGNVNIKASNNVNESDLNLNGLLGTFDLKGKAAGIINTQISSDITGNITIESPIPIPDPPLPIPDPPVANKIVISKTGTIIGNPLLPTPVVNVASLVGCSIQLGPTPSPVIPACTIIPNLLVLQPTLLS